MEFSELKELIETVSASDLTEFSLERKDLKISLKKEAVVERVTVASQLIESDAAPVAVASAPVDKSDAPAKSVAEAEGWTPVKSPIIGTFYRSPNPTANPFVKVGSQVSDDMTICIVEAMKVMNEIKANCSGQVVKIMVENGQPVEYDQVLFYIKSV